MADINPDSIPFVPPTDIALIDVGTGKPKTAFHDWLTTLWSWMKRSVVDLTTKITTLGQEIEGASAAIVEESIARANADGALAAQITAVDAKANNATASGAVYLAAKAAPSGAIASYGWHLTAGNSFAGMEAIALSGGGSAIGFTANRFRFTDAGTAQPVFAYSGGAFVFQVPVVIQSGTSGERTINNGANIKVYDAGNVLRVALGVGI